MLKQLIELLESHKVITNSNCWELDNKINIYSNEGYYYIYFQKGLILIHRASAVYYLKLNLANPKELALHINECHNRKCWNPSHLYVGSHADNVRDAIELGNFGCTGLGQMLPKCSFCVKRMTKK